MIYNKDRFVEVDLISIIESNPELKKEFENLIQTKLNFYMNCYPYKDFDKCSDIKYEKIEPLENEFIELLYGQCPCLKGDTNLSRIILAKTNIFAHRVITEATKTINRIIEKWYKQNKKDAIKVVLHGVNKKYIEKILFGTEENRQKIEELKEKIKPFKLDDEFLIKLATIDLIYKTFGEIINILEECNGGYKISEDEEDLKKLENCIRKKYKDVIDKDALTQLMLDIEMYTTEYNQALEHNEPGYVMDYYVPEYIKKMDKDKLFEI